MASKLTMTGNLKSAEKIISRAITADAISRKDLQKARGIVFLSALKGAWFFSGALGRGFFMKRDEEDEDKWSNPVAIALVQGGAGLQFGLHKEQLILILKSRAAVRRFENVGSLQISADLSISAGTTGGVCKGGVAVNQRSVSGVSAFAVSRGVFFGLSLEGVIVATNPPMNKSFYENQSANQRSIFRNEVSLPLGKKRNAVLKVHHMLANLEAGRNILARMDKLRDQIEGVDKDVPVATPVPQSDHSSTDDDSIPNLDNDTEEKAGLLEAPQPSQTQTPPRVTSFIFE
ncbi:SH3 domain-containing YSC84-like protein 1 [Hondaea fermentalgiana]|uniref:SH3 domain-containing YSC84-like protein 1 n=1 Tax=Hondaea fermentalgiana TaxID=2315210 RepID=A0A2R5G9K2_9STRA|nr:SH3 domain-containing YSC84-like protein 1 [Hondaea fermentalgiana]|eukprot:GBG27710.1 SH3 domain-containing YSC84-like protein 1 [Hondaea fermentalgiana]